MADNEINLLCLSLAGRIVELYEKIDQTDDTRKIYNDVSDLLNKLHQENDQLDLTLINLISENELLSLKLKRALENIDSLDSALQGS